MTKLDGKTAEGQDHPIPIPGAFTKAKQSIRDRHGARGGRLCELLLSKRHVCPAGLLKKVGYRHLKYESKQIAQTAHSTSQNTVQHAQRLNGYGEAQAAPQPPYP
jgi:hypothetical protein